MFDALHAYLFFGTSSSLLLLLMAVFVGGFRSHRSKASFVILVLSLAFWSVADVLELLGPSEAWCIYWYGTIRTSAICIANVSWLYFCLHYADFIHTRWGSWLIRTSVTVFGIYAATTWTPWRSLIYKNLEFRPHDWLWSPHFREVGDLFGSYLFCALASFLIGLSILCNYVYRSSPTGRRQVLIVLGSFVILAAISFLNGFGYLGNSIIDKTVFVFPVVVMSLLTALFRHGFLQSDPILLAALMNHLPDRVLVLDENGYLSEANPAGTEWIESSARCVPVNPVDRSDRNRVRSRSPAIHQRLVDYVGPDSELGQFVAELPMGRSQICLTTAQQQAIYAVNAIPLDASNRKGTLVTFRDETRMHHALEDLKAYATTVAHDLKNPLSAIVTYCDLLNHSKENSEHEALTEFVPPIQEAAQSMNSIISDLLLIADLERSCDSEFVAVNMEELTDNVVRRLTRLRPDVRVLIERQQPWPSVLGHPTWLEMIMMNLVSNAIEHSQTAEDAITISCEDEAELTFNITNQDHGMSRNRTPSGESPSATDARIQDAVQSEQETANPGRPRGFGLSIVRRLVERQGGKFGMHQQPNGMRVWFHLHRATDNPESAKEL